MQKSAGGHPLGRSVRRLFAVFVMTGLTAIACDAIPTDANEPAIAEPYQTLRSELLEIHEQDQTYRWQIEEIRKTNPKPHDGYERTLELQRKMGEADARNTTRVKAILTQHGWLAPEQVGRKASEALFFVIQHADTATQVEFLPMIRQAVKDGKLQAILLPLLEDRVALHTGRKQIYGTQIGSNIHIVGYYVQPLEDPENVDKRRAEMGLEPLAEYVKRWNIIWDVEAYKKQLPELEAMQKRIRFK